MTAATSFRLPADLMERVRAEADVRGQSLTVFVTRALEAELERTRIAASLPRPMWVGAAARAEEDA